MMNGMLAGLPPWARYVQALLAVLVCAFPNAPGLSFVGQCVALKMALEFELDCQHFYEKREERKLTVAKCPEGKEE